MRPAQPAAARALSVVLTALSVVLTGRRLALGFLRPLRCDSGLCAMDPRLAAAVVTPAPGYRGSRPPRPRLGLEVPGLWLGWPGGVGAWGFLAAASGFTSLVFEADSAACAPGS